MICYFLVLDHPSLSQLADEETPTSTSRNLGTSERGVVEEDEEDYNDISSKIDEREDFNLIIFAVLLIDSPVNSTTVENHSGASCHQPLEFSIISRPRQGANEANGDSVSNPEQAAKVPERSAPAFVSDPEQIERSTLASVTTGVSVSNLGQGQLKHGSSVLHSSSNSSDMLLTMANNSSMVNRSVGTKQFMCNCGRECTRLVSMYTSPFSILFCFQ